MCDNMQIISNQFLTVGINPLGATLWSIRDKETDTEYVWQGDPKYWVNRAPNLFPYVGRLTEGRYRLYGKEYEMVIHGFSRNSLFQVVQSSQDMVTFRLQDSQETLVQYPYHFVFDVTYQLEGNRIAITYRVENCNDNVMYFGIGAHPGFMVPLEEGLAFED